MTSLLKRSLSYGGFKTSICMEAPFWTELDRMADEVKQPVSAFALSLRNQIGPTANLASALRVMILVDLQKQVAHKSTQVAQ